MASKLYQWNDFRHDALASFRLNIGNIAYINVGTRCIEQPITKVLYSPWPAEIFYFRKHRSQLLQAVCIQAHTLPGWYIQASFWLVIIVSSFAASAILAFRKLRYIHASSILVLRYYFGFSIKQIIISHE